jgi:hypothetical protein
MYPLKGFVLSKLMSTAGIRFLPCGRAVSAGFPKNAAITGSLGKLVNATESFGATLYPFADVGSQRHNS